LQNKMHWAAHGHTAAEIISTRADATKPNMGLTNWAGARPRKAIPVATNRMQSAAVMRRLITEGPPQ
jgi:hypothetical protein